MEVVLQLFHDRRHCDDFSHVTILYNCDRGKLGEAKGSTELLIVLITLNIVLDEGYRHVLISLGDNVIALASSFARFAPRSPDIDNDRADLGFFKHSLPVTILDREEVILSGYLPLRGLCSWGCDCLGHH